MLFRKGRGATIDRSTFTCVIHVSFYSLTPPLPQPNTRQKTKTKYSVVITSDSLHPSAHSTWGYIQCLNKKIASDNNEDFYLCECVYTGASKHANVAGTKSHRSHGDGSLLFVTVILSLRCHRSCARRKILASSTSKPFRDRRTAAGCSQPPDFSPKEPEYPPGAILKIVLLNNILSISTLRLLVLWAESTGVQRRVRL